MPIRAPYKRDSHSTQYNMDLPAGKTCGDCLFSPRCVAIYGHIAEDATCDWSPSQFVERLGRR